MDNHFIKLTGKANIPEALEIDTNYKVTTDCSITDIKKSSNQDGTYDMTYIAEAVTAEIQKENGEIIKAKDPRSNSLKIRNSFWKVYFDSGQTEDYSKVYDEITWVILSMKEMIYKEAVKRLQK